MKKLFLILTMMITGMACFAYTPTADLENEIVELKDKLRDLITQLNDKGEDASDYYDVTQLRNEIGQKEHELAKIKRDNRNEEVWGRIFYINLGYKMDEATINDTKAVFKSYTGIMFNYGAMFPFHSNPIGNFLKFKFDLQVLDLCFDKYTYQKSHIPENNLMYKDLNKWECFLGIFGVGPRLIIAPFGTSSKNIAFLKLSAYARYVPTFGLFTAEDTDGQDTVKGRYENVFQVGGVLSYKSFGIGVQKDWTLGYYCREKAKLNGLRFFISFIL